VPFCSAITCPADFSEYPTDSGYCFADSAIADFEASYSSPGTFPVKRLDDLPSPSAGLFPTYTNASRVSTTVSSDVVEYYVALNALLCSQDADADACEALSALCLLGHFKSSFAPCAIHAANLTGIGSSGADVRVTLADVPDSMTEGVITVAARSVLTGNLLYSAPLANELGACGSNPLLYGGVVSSSLSQCTLDLSALASSSALSADRLVALDLAYEYSDSGSTVSTPLPVIYLNDPTWAAADLYETLAAKDPSRSSRIATLLSGVTDSYADFDAFLTATASPVSRVLTAAETPGVMYLSDTLVRVLDYAELRVARGRVPYLIVHYTDRAVALDAGASAPPFGPPALFVPPNASFVVKTLARVTCFSTSLPTSGGPGIDRTEFFLLVSVALAVFTGGSAIVLHVARARGPALAVPLSVYFHGLCKACGGVSAGLLLFIFLVSAWNILPSRQPGSLAYDTSSSSFPFLIPPAVPVTYSSFSLPYIGALPLPTSALPFALLLGAALALVNTAARVFSQASVAVCPVDWESPPPPSAAMPSPSAGGQTTPDPAAAISCWRRLYAHSRYETMALSRYASPSLSAALAGATVAVAMATWPRLSPLATQATSLSDAVIASAGLVSAGSATWTPAMVFLSISAFAFFQLVQLLIITPVRHRVSSAHPILTLTDLLSVANVSLALLDGPASAWYIHGRSVHSSADVAFPALLKQLDAERQGAAATRGLLPSTTDQLFRVYFAGKAEQELVKATTTDISRCSATLSRTPGPYVVHWDLVKANQRLADLFAASMRVAVSPSSSEQLPDGSRVSPVAVVPMSAVDVIFDRPVNFQSSGQTVLLTSRSLLSLMIRDPQSGADASGCAPGFARTVSLCGLEPDFAVLHTLLFAGCAAFFGQGSGVALGIAAVIVVDAALRTARRQLGRAALVRRGGLPSEFVL
jgi:hypothetical protein